MSETTFGTLNDVEIKELAQAKQLIVENYKEENVKQACYETRVGNEYFVINGTDSKKIELKEDGEIVFRPHQTIVVISKEKFVIPNNILARFLTKGSLFSLGFIPVNTYADPGFEGHMGIVMTNASNNYVKMRNGDVIAKVEFSRLQNAVQHSYHGQHGYETGIWPLKTEYIMSQDEVEQKVKNYNEMSELEASYGTVVAGKLEKLYVYGRRFFITSIVIILIDLAMIGIITVSDALHYILAFTTGIISNVIVLVIEWFYFKGRRKK